MHSAVVGLMFGDEGKGAVVDYIADQYAYVVRYNGGANAGHTVKVGDRTVKCHLLPSGIVKEKDCVLTHGMAIDPRQLAKEIKESGYKIEPHDGPTVYVSDKAHCVMPWHIEKDVKYGKTIGTTVKGIGPCYADKMHRFNAIRMGDLKSALESSERDKRFFSVEKTLYGSTSLYDNYLEAANFLQPFICNTEKLLRLVISQQNVNVLFESANGMMLDVDFGSYPYVTSSCVGPAAIPQLCGLPNFKLDKIIGVIKSYMTRVGAGPFRTELTNETGNKIRETGKEYGTTTGRPRRVGWLDLDTVKESIGHSGATEIALMHVDVLFGFDYIEYVANNKTYKVKGWKCIGEYELDSYKKQIEDFLERPITLISFGPDRKQKVSY